MESPNFTTKLENTFLSILRIVILISLTLTLAVSIYFAISGLLHMNAKPEQYKHENISAEETIKELKSGMQPKEQNDAEEPTSTAPVPKSKDKPNAALDGVLNKQIEIIDAFLGQFNLRITNQQQTKLIALNSAREYAPSKSDDGLQEYIGNRNLYLNNVLTNKELNEIVKKNASSNDYFAGKYVDVVIARYDYFYSKQADKKKKFNLEQETRVALERAGAFAELYVAAGMFGSFLLISLVLVLVKIERDLRYRQQPI